MRQVHVPATLSELWEILQEEPDAALYAGGTDLLVKLRSGLIDPPSLVCLERIEEIRGVQDRDNDLFIGAGTTHTRLLESDLINRHFPVLVKALEVLAAPPIRHMGTIGGNIVNASPAGDTLPPLYVLHAEVEIRSRSESRKLPLADFIAGPGRTRLSKGEILSGVWARKIPEFNVQHYEKIGKRKAQACSIAGMAAVLRVSDAGTIERARLAWGSLGPTVVYSRGVEQALEGKPFSAETLKEAGRLAQGIVNPIADVRAGIEYRRRVITGLLLGLTRCSRQAISQTGPRTVDWA
jgi:CO/xanthine dehydrogenase FAD-binding subunit